MNLLQALTIAATLAVMTSPAATAAALETTSVEVFAKDPANCAWFEAGGQVDPYAASMNTQMAWADVQSDLQAQQLSLPEAAAVVARICGWPARPGTAPAAKRRVEAAPSHSAKNKPFDGERP